MRVRMAADVVVRDLSGEVVLLNLAEQTYYGLDEVGTRIWHLLAEYGSTEAIVPFLLQEFEIEEHFLRRDVEMLVERLLAKGLLTQVPKVD